MLQYILECIAFQLSFLVIYDFFLKRETFFQWNRAYLIGTYLLSMVLPWIKIEALKTSVSEQYYVYPEFLWNTNSAVVVAVDIEKSVFQFSWQEVVLYSGMFLAALYFGYKLYRLAQLRKQGTTERFPNFTRIEVKNSELAFSFFRSIFLGDKILSREHKSIIQHELVHIKQKHSLDLVFFELMRIIGWFNPLVYVSQNRIAELHEFIADAQVPKTERKAHYDLLLSQVFQTQNISFVNHFFNTSLIKKRIVMLQKSKSKKVFQLKYLLLVPMVFGMLAYTSVERSAETPFEKSADTLAVEQQVNFDKASEPIAFAEVENVPVFPSCENDDDKRACFNDMMLAHISKNFSYPLEAQEKGIQGRVSLMFIIGTDGKVKNLKMRGPDSLLENEAKRIIDLLPIMQAGKHKGKSVDVAYSIPITFKLDNAITSDKESEARSPATSERELVSKYKELLTERNRLLKSTDEKNPIILDLDEKIQALEESIIVSMERSEQSLVSAGAADVPFSVVDEIPIFPGCEEAENKRACFNEMMQKHIGANFQYPQGAMEKGIQGRVNTIFTIGRDGVVSNLRMRGADPLLENEAKRIIELLPKMTPGKQKGKVVEVLYSIPISFVWDTGFQTERSTAKVPENGFNLSLPENAKAVYMVDGVETPIDEVRKISPDALESITVLKGKSAEDKYGQKGKNGVIIITLKKKD